MLHDELERLAVAVCALTEDAGGCQIGHDGCASPLLPLLDVREGHFDDGCVEKLQSVANRVGVVSPRAGVHDDSVGPIERVVAPLDVLAFVICLTAANVAPESRSPLGDARLALRE